MAQGELRNKSSDAEALKMLKQSGILNPDVTLEEVFDLSEKLQQLSKLAVPSSLGTSFIDRVKRNSYVLARQQHVSYSVLAPW